MDKRRYRVLPRRCALACMRRVETSQPSNWSLSCLVDDQPSREYPCRASHSNRLSRTIGFDSGSFSLFKDVTRERTRGVSVCGMWEAPPETSDPAIIADNRMEAITDDNVLTGVIMERWHVDELRCAVSIICQQPSLMSMEDACWHFFDTGSRLHKRHSWRSTYLHVKLDALRWTDYLNKTGDWLSVTRHGEAENWTPNLVCDFIGSFHQQRKITLKKQDRLEAISWVTLPRRLRRHLSHLSLVESWEWDSRPRDNSSVVDAPEVQI